MNQTPDQLQSQIRESSAWIPDLKKNIGQVIIGQDYMIEGLIIGLLTNGHILLEGVPGLAKTLAVSTLASAVHAEFSRIQFTPDLLPADIVGTLIYQPHSGEFETKKGPIFANLVLADEVNRAPAKVQSALLEAMQERQVTIGDETHKLPAPFLVLATENPIDQEGTYPLPEAQVDRFTLKLKVDYPSPEEESKILDMMAKTGPKPEIRPSLEIDTIIQARKLIDQIHISDTLKGYIVDLILATRKPKDFKLDIGPFIEFGASPRATIALAICARAHAFLRGEAYASPEDVKAIAPEVLRHRIIPSYEAEAEGLDSDMLVQTLLDAIPVP